MALEHRNCMKTSFTLCVQAAQLQETMQCTKCSCQHIIRAHIIYKPGRQVI